MARRTGTPVADVELVIRGDIPNSARVQAQQMISQLARHTEEPILHARVKLIRSADPARGHRAVTAQANINLNGRLIRAQVSAPSAHEGIDLLSDALRHRISHLAQRWEALRGGTPKAAPHEWRHSSEHAHRPTFFPRPAQERQILRHKAFELTRSTPDEAIEDLELMGYDFQLFTDVESNQDSVLYRSGPTGYRIAQLIPDAERRWLTAEPISISTQPVPELDEHEAIERLNLTELPFLFYRDKASRRGQVLYRRYDGHYGVITPAN